MPSSAVWNRLIGSGPGSASRAKAPTIRPQKNSRIRIDDEAHARSLRGSSAASSAAARSRLGRSRSARL